MKYVRVDLVGFVIWNVNIKLTLVITSLNQYILKMSIIQTIIGLSIACNVRRVLPLRWLICLLDVFAWYRYRWIIKKQQITITAKTAVIDRYLVSVSSSSKINIIVSHFTFSGSKGCRKNAHLFINLQLPAMWSFIQSTTCV